MRLTKIEISEFKKISKVEIDLASINVIVGGNNAGKSSVLQGIHFAVSAGVASRERSETTFAADLLTYVPSADFVNLRHGQSYQNSRAEQSYSGVTFSAEIGDESYNYKISIRRGRNYGNISCDREGNFPLLGTRITDPLKPFSIYVPGLAGIPQFEEFRSKRSVVRGIASGDANLYLRNVLLLLHNDNKLSNLKSWMERLFPNFNLEVKFNTERDTQISVKVLIQERWTPLELVGTGVQQALQIFSYVCLFNPMLLLLDEPDSHLHPTNQYALCEALKIVAAESKTCVIASTHSKHIVDALTDEAKFIWLKNGSIHLQGGEIPRLPLLMDLGALDNFDKIANGKIDFVILSEDAKTGYLKKLLINSGFKTENFLIFSYKTSSQLISAYLLVDFIKEIAPKSQIIIHRDRDFMTNDEVAIVEAKITSQGAIPFITEGCDIESYFCRANHVAVKLGITIEEARNWILDIININPIEVQHDFTNKRNEIKNQLYRSRLISDENEPKTLDLLGTHPFTNDKIPGKTLLKKLRTNMQSKFSRSVELADNSMHLDLPELRVHLGS